MLSAALLCLELIRTGLPWPHNVSPALGGGLGHGHKNPNPSVQGGEANLNILREQRVKVVHTCVL